MCETRAASGKAERAELFDPAVGIEQAREEAEACLALRGEVGGRNELVRRVTPPETELLERGGQWVGDDPLCSGPMCAFSLNDPVVVVSGMRDGHAVANGSFDVAQDLRI